MIIYEFTPTVIRSRITLRVPTEAPQKKKSSASQGGASIGNLKHAGFKTVKCTEVYSCLYLWLSDRIQRRGMIPFSSAYKLSCIRPRSVYLSLVNETDRETGIALVQFAVIAVNTYADMKRRIRTIQDADFGSE